MKYVKSSASHSLFAGLVFCLVSLAGCDNDDEASPTPNPDDSVALSEQRLTTGFVLSTVTPTNSYFARYYAELPTGEVDLSEGTDFQSFFPDAVYNGALYDGRLDGSGGFAKIVVDGNENIIEEAFIPTTAANSFVIAVRDATTGVFHDRGTPNQLTIFNPTTMTVEGTIDLSEGFVPGDEPQRYSTINFKDDEVFAGIRPEGGGSYDSMIVHVANISAGTYTGTTTINGGAAFPFNDFGQNELDEAGNLYLQDQGDVTTANASSLFRIAAGSNEFDPDYNFEMATVLNPQNVFLPIFRGFRYLGDGAGLALVAASTPQAAIDLVTSVGGVGNLSEEQTSEIRRLLDESPTARWCTVDVNAQTVTPIEGIPEQSVFGTTSVMEADGLLYLPVATAEINSLYRYDPATGETAKVFDVVGGGQLQGVFNLANNN